MTKCVVEIPDGFLRDENGEKVVYILGAGKEFKFCRCKAEPCCGDGERGGVVEIGTLGPGMTVRVGEIEVEILDCGYPSWDDAKGVLCLAKDVLFERAFDETNRNNWKTSSLRECLNGVFREWLPPEITDAILPFKRDLISDDGMDDYGVCKDYVSLISDDEYRRYRKSISDKSKRWWTLTPYTCLPEYSQFVQRVRSDGLRDRSNACNENVGVVPAYLFKPSLEVEVEVV